MWWVLLKTVKVIKKKTERLRNYQESEKSTETWGLNTMWSSRIEKRSVANTKVPMLAV